MGLKSEPLSDVTKKAELIFSICSGRTFPKSDICVAEVAPLNLCALKKTLIEPVHGVLRWILPRPSWISASGPGKIEIVEYFSKFPCL